VEACQRRFKAATESVNTGRTHHDGMQAQTPHAQRIQRAKAERGSATALGTVAADMAMSPDTLIALPPVAGGRYPGRGIRPLDRPI